MFHFDDHDIQDDLELPTERRIRESPLKPSEEQLITHYQCKKIYDIAEKAIQHAAPHHFLNCLEIHKVQHATLKAPDGSNLLLKVHGTCKSCKQPLTLVNVHSKKSHFYSKDGSEKSCIRLFKKGTEEGASQSNKRRLSIDPRSSDASSMSFQKKLKASTLKGGQTPITNFLLPSSVGEVFKDNFCRLLFESCGSLPLATLDLPRVKSMFQMLGMEPPTRKWVSTTKLKQVFEETQDETLALLEAGGGEGWFSIGSDGWRSKYVEHSEKLINFLALLPDGGAVFLGIEKTNGETVDTNALADILLNGAMKAVSGSEEEKKMKLRKRLLGFVLDGEAVNHSALRQLRVKLNHPSLMGIVCVAHSLNLLVKDVCDKLPVIRKAVISVKKVATYFNDTTAAKRALKEYQQKFYNKSKPLRMPPDTRFAYIVRLLSDVLENQAALQSVVLDPELQMADERDNYWEVADIVGRRDFWTASQAIHRLLEPIGEAIVAIQGDRPYLSQCFPMWENLRSEMKKQLSTDATQNILKYGTEQTTSAAIMECFDRRRNKAQSPLWIAAYILDLKNLVPGQQGGNYKPPVVDLSKYYPATALTRSIGQERDPVLAELCTLFGDTVDNLDGPKSDKIVVEMTTFRISGIPADVAMACGAGPSGIKAPIAFRRDAWLSMTQKFPMLAQIAAKLLSMHATSCGPERNWSQWRWLYRPNRSCLHVERAEMMLAISSNAQLKAKDLRSLEEIEDELDLAALWEPEEGTETQD